MTYQVVKTTYVDRRISLREGAFFFTRTMLFPPLNKKNTRDKGMPLLALAIDKFVEERAIEELRSDLVQ